MSKERLIQETNIEVFSVFNNDKKDVFLYQKVQRLVSGIYIVSELIKDSEPMKGRVRSAALSLIETSSKIILKLSVNERTHELELLSVAFAYIISLIHVSFVAGLVSEMNYDVLRKEFEETLTLVNNLYSKNDDHLFEAGTALSRSFFNVKSHGEQVTENVVHRTPSTNKNEITNVLPGISKKDNPFFFKGHVKDIINGTAFTERNRNVQSNRLNSKSIFDHSNRPSASILNTSDRSALIISMIKSQGPLTIRDFALKITDCSEKTIQRILNGMLEKGIIKRIGERRWSKYIL